MRLCGPLALAAASVALSLASGRSDAHKTMLALSFDSATLEEIAATSPSSTCTGISNPLAAITNKCLCKPCDLCKLDLSTGKCRLIKPAALSTSDGSDEPVEQPALSPQEWFLTDAEMTVSRGGVPRNTLRLWTANNSVTTFVAANEYFDSVYADLEAATKKDCVWITGWSFDDVPMQPQVNAAKVNGTKVAAVLQRLATKGVDWHVLDWANALETDQNLAFATKVNAIQPTSVQGGAYFVFDDRVSDATASQHQKTITIQRRQGIVAYIGGTDLTWDRWDTAAHNVSDLRKRTGIEKGTNRGWMDAHMKVDGPAASDVANNFLQRWNMKRKPLGDLLDKLHSFKNPPFSNLPELSSGSLLVENKKGTHAVQIVRTYPCDYEYYDAFAPKGELSNFQSRLKAIKMAKNFIFIEDQYFLHVPQLMDALLQVLPRLQRLVIVSQPASASSTRYGFRKYQWQMIKPLTDKYPNKVQVFRTKAARNIYIHSKLVIVDDVFLSIGSANWNRRSMTTDTEITANVVDDNTVKTPDGIVVGRVARDYRVRKFMEMTGKSYAEIDGMKLLAAFDALTTAANDPSTILAPYAPEEDASFIVYTDAVQAVADPLETCGSRL